MGTGAEGAQQPSLAAEGILSSKPWTVDMELREGMLQDLMSRAYPQNVGGRVEESAMDPLPAQLLRERPGSPITSARSDKASARGGGSLSARLRVAEQRVIDQTLAELEFAYRRQAADIRKSHGQETTTISPLRRHSTQGGVTSSASLLQDATVLATQAMEAERQQQDLLRALYSDLVSAQARRARDLGGGFIQTHSSSANMAGGCGNVSNTRPRGRTRSVDPAPRYSSTAMKRLQVLQESLHLSEQEQQRVERFKSSNSEAERIRRRVQEEFTREERMGNRLLKFRM